MNQPEQTEIPGTEQQLNPNLKVKARSYQNAKQEADEAKEAAENAKLSLIEDMEAQNVEIFKLSDGTIVRLTDKKGIKLEVPKGHRQKQSEN